MRKKSGKDRVKGDAAGLPQLSRRERQIMDALYRLQRASAQEIWEAVPDRPTYTAMRSHLSLLEKRGHVRHDQEGAKYIYSPVVPREEMGGLAIEGVLKTFFDGSVDLVVKALLKRKQSPLTREQIDRIERLIDDARKESR
jgi:predicted transcriptional regulator